ncbi:hypothetical protein [Biostraticola tofi]|uniref:Uncharacterized protein n=1 Tax=Biostraticola tofi TaxID=466109 RepID=A0A4R3YLI1_9GAMM|nr:hypothetical protein [Biostraticola tofi]TCV91914.1 hypothetical protein EDC52_11420 [Biostraticola tofi]
MLVGKYMLIVPTELPGPAADQTLAALRCRSPWVHCLTNALVDILNLLQQEDMR